MDDLILKNQTLAQEVERQAQEARLHMDRMAAINTVASTVSQSLDLDKTLATALEVVTNVTKAEAGGISLIDEKTQEVVLRAQLGWANDFISKPMRVPMGEGMSGEVIESDRVLVENDLINLRTGRHEIADPRFLEEPFRSIVMAPMHARGKIIGILSIMSKRPENFDSAVIELLQAVADTVGVALDNARLYENSVENENRFGAILQSTADGIITTDQGGAITMVNPSAEKMLGVATVDVCERPLREAPIPDALRELLLPTLSSRTESPSFQVNMPDKRVLLVFVSPVWAADNTIDPTTEQDGWVIVLQDVTHLREAEEMRMQFIQAAAHDMRNPIGAIKTSIGILDMMVSEDNPDGQEAIDIALSGVTRMQRLLDDLLNLERIENGNQFKIEACDLAGILYEVCAQMRPLLQQKGQTHTLDVQDVLGMVPVDAHWISRALANYVGNAAKYTQEGGHIIVRAFIKEGFVHIEVTDNGPGIPRDVQSRLFERFYRVKDATKESGSGLGLAIVKSVVEAHGGRVYMRSKVGDGSTFVMALPMPQG